MMRLALRNRARRDAAVIVVMLAFSFLAIERAEVYTFFFTFVQDNPDTELEAAILTGMLASLGLTVFAARRWADLRDEMKCRHAAEVQGVRSSGTLDGGS